MLPRLATVHKRWKVPDPTNKQTIKHGLKIYNDSVSLLQVEKATTAIQAAGQLNELVAVHEKHCHYDTSAKLFIFLC